MDLSASSWNDDHRVATTVSGSKRFPSSDGRAQRQQTFKSSPLSVSLSTVSTADNSSFSSIHYDLASGSDLDLESIVRRASSIVYSRHSLESVHFYEEEDLDVSNEEEECDVSKRNQGVNSNDSNSTTTPWYSNFQPSKEFSSRENDILLQLCGELQRLKEMSAIQPDTDSGGETDLALAVERKRRVSQSILQRHSILIEASQRSNVPRQPPADFADLLKAADDDPSQKQLLERLGHFVATPRLKRLHDHDNPYTDRVYQEIPGFVKEEDAPSPQFESVATVQKGDPDYVPVVDYCGSSRPVILRKLWKRIRRPANAAA